MDLTQRKQLELSFGRSVFRRFLSENGFSNDVSDTFDSLTELYLKVNSVINISALKTFEDIYIKHYLDSVFPYYLFDGSCCDVGCGGGFPCLPLAIVTKLDFTGIDGVGKKLSLIKLCNTELGIQNIKGVHARAEEIAKTQIFFDMVCARAVADTDKVLKYCAPLAKKNGKIILYKTPNDEKATTVALKKTKTELSDVKDYVLNGTDIKRRVFVYRKLV